MQADPSEAKRRLGWEPTVAFRDLVRIMGRRSRCRGPARAGEGDALPYRWSAGVAHAAVKKG